DANHNPSDAHLDQNRAAIALGYTHATGAGDWTTTLSVDKSDEDIVRGFLADVCTEAVLSGPDNACGFTQDRKITDLYFDTHFISRLSDHASAVWGVDYMYGKGKQDAEVFAYDVNEAHGGNAPSSSEVLSEEEGRLEANGSENKRNFAGLYG